MTCPWCKKDIPDESVKCPKCFAAIPKKSDDDKTEPNPRKEMEVKNNGEQCSK